MTRPAIAAAFAASLAVPAAPALAAPAETAAPAVTVPAESAAPAAAPQGWRGFSLGAYSGFETDHGLRAWGPAFGLNVTLDLAESYSLVATPRYNAGAGFPAAVKVPVALRRDLSLPVGLYTAFGPYWGHVPAAPGTAAATDIGAQVETGFSLPLAGVVFEVGGEAGYGFLNPAGNDVPWSATFKLGARI
ncbi:MAG: hypothetical protein FJZ01_22395 [Candidatus Sericytochromatia bacterium]|nr:hypothetical protein [Candidatus Tanganyikabacteria bacterium]